MSENITDIINRLRGKGPVYSETPTQSENQPEISALPENKAALENFLNQTPEVIIPEEEKKYTMEDFNNYVDSLLEAKK